MNWVELADPARGWWALLAIPIIALFVLRVRLRRRPVTTLLFWQQLLDEQPPRRWWQRLRNLVALLLQLAFLGLVVAALVNPLWTWQRRDARAIVFVVDNSTSMKATDPGRRQTRIELAKTTLQRLLRSMRQRDTAAIVTAGGLPDVVVSTTDDVRVLRDGADSIRAKDQPTRLLDAVRLARRVAADSGRREIVVLTDGGDSAAAQLDAADDVQLYGFGEASGNTAITALQARRSVTDATSFQVLVEVTHFGDQATECRLDLTLDGEVVDVVPLTLQPDQPWRQTLDHTSPEGGHLLASLDIQDPLPADNRAVAILPDRDPVAVLLVSPGNLFLEGVLRSIPNLKLSIARSMPESLPVDALLVVHQTELARVPDDRGVIVVQPTGDSDLWQLGESISEPIVAWQADQSPLTAHLRLNNVVLGTADRIEFNGQSETLLKSPDEAPLYAKLPRGGKDVLVLSVHLNQGDLPLRIAFPVMMKNAIEKLSGEKGELDRSRRAGDTALIEDEWVKTSPKPAPRTVSVRRPDATRYSLTASGGSLRIGPLDQAGVWRIDNADEDDAAGPEDATAARAGTSDRIEIAVNHADPDESDLRPRVELAAAPQARVAWGGYSPWFYLSLSAALGICVEWFLYQRRMIG